MAARALALLLPPLVLLGCPETPSGGSEPTEECRNLGDRCRLPDGPLGVCNDSGRTDCAAPPCLACMPQH